MKSSHVLGMNARNQLFTSLNSSRARSICSSKYATKILLANKQIPTAEIFGVLTSGEDVNEFDWQSLQNNFVIKPTNGNAGKGVVAFKKKLENSNSWIDTLGKSWSFEDIKLHCLDILEGQYSTYGSQHNIIIEERIPIHSKLQKFAYKGTPDIRVLVYNHVPVMALLRLPTKESEGRANQSQGAIGVGIDMATGITTQAAAHKNEVIKYLPGTKRKLNGIRIPFWKSLLKTAVDASAAAGLQFSGIDMFVHEEKGPMVVELNSNPGLSLQIANNAGLRRRLDRVSDLNVLNSDHGVRISQALFAENFSDKIKAKEGLRIVSPHEEVTLHGDGGRTEIVLAQFNTGRFRSAISSKIAEKLGLIQVDDLLWFQKVGGEDKAPVVEIKYSLKDSNRTTTAVVLKRLNRSKHKIEIGRKDLGNLLVGIQS